MMKVRDKKAIRDIAVKTYKADLKRKNPDLHTAPKGSIIKSLRYGSDESERLKRIEETNAMG